METIKPTMNLEGMERNAEKAEATLKLLANSKRLMILCHLIDGKKTVSELSECVGLSQSSLSQHLAKMRQNELLTTDKHGKQVFYHIAKPEVNAILTTLHQIYCRE